MTEVTIEGSITPSAVLARGQRRTVRMTDRIQRLIDRGYVVLVEDSAGLTDTELVADAAAAADSSEDLEVAPAGNASRELWAQFLTGQGIEFTDEYGRDDLIALWYDR